MIVHSCEELCKLYVIIKQWKLISVYALRCFDDLLTSEGTCPLQSMNLVMTSKCWTAVKDVCVTKIGEAAEYFTN